MKPLPFLILSLPAFVVTAKRNCKCTSYDPCWPNDAAFQALQSQLSTTLLHPKPPESACYPTSNPSGNCTDVQSHATDGNWRSDQPGSTYGSNFESFIFPNGTIEACYLNTTLGIPCAQGSVSVVGVDARTIGDIQAAVKFSATYNLRLVVKNTGHDLLGRGAARGSFLLWTHNLKNITYNEAFMLVSAPASETFKAITLGAGVQWHEAYDVASANRRLLVGGVSAGGSVGAAGGWIMGGGHSGLSPSHGLGVDNVLQFTIVVADGRHLTVDKYHHSDLFWALRGGGGGTYGVVTSVTYRTYGDLPVSGVTLLANFTSQMVARDATAEFIRFTPELASSRWGGSNVITPGVMAMSYVAVNTTVNDTVATIDPFFRRIQNITGDAFYDVQPYDSYYSWLRQVTSGPDQAGMRGELGSRLIPQTSVKVNATQLADVFVSLGTVIWVQVAGGVVSQVSPSTAGLNPSWRDAIALAIWSGGWSDGASVTEIDAVRESLKSETRMVEAVVPGSGTYFNEASLYEDDFMRTFFGSHYPELKRIKRRYDPLDLFIVAKGVGSDDWDDALLCPR